ncbi:MAG TPA: hypothetical protein PKK74_03900 [Candidatus Methanoculleus thermohydrogenotrophicum]|nr:hypothetical protein [Candidatus Methanoculleus thermohydrogenotrophicum]HPZ37996.1 hypothetical protein [Candidatus Methanoculleus thermohydrogenotrophicum]HQC91194.1 hypothetical protein [Candidatus Methanoculleus thermohydrogenotrophicum]
MRPPLLTYAIAVLCIGMLALLALPGAVGTAPQEAPTTVSMNDGGDPAPVRMVTPPPISGKTGLSNPDLIGFEAAPDVPAGEEKPVTPKVPVTLTAPQSTDKPEETPASGASKEKAVNESAPPLVVDGGVAETTTLPVKSTTTSEKSGTADSSTSPEVVTWTATTTDNANETPGATPTRNLTVSPRVVAWTAAAAEDDNETEEESDDETEEEEEINAEPTLEREAPPRPSATMAKSHKSHHRPLVLGDHPVVNPGSPTISSEEQTRVLPAATESSDGLVVSGVGILLARGPEDVPLTRNGVEIANLDWLLDPAMRLGGRHPRVAHEGETFTITVTVEARNVTLTKGDPAYVVLLPPPGETGVYEITRTSEPAELRDGERAVWEFSVFTRTGRLMLEDLTLSEERQVTSLTSTPDIFAFSAYAFTADQEHPSVRLSDPVITIRPAGEADIAKESSLPALYTLAGIQNSTLLPSETITAAWARGVSHETITAEAAGHLDALANLERNRVITIYAEENGTGGDIGADVSAAGSSPLDLIVGLLRGLVGWFGG